MGNLDFTNQPGIAWYCVFLLISGALLVVSSLIPKLAAQNRNMNLIFGLLFIAYGGYVTFVHLFISRDTIISWTLSVIWYDARGAGTSKACTLVA